MTIRHTTVIQSRTQISGCDQLDVVNIRKTQQQLKESNGKTTNLEEREGQASSHTAYPHRKQVAQRKECVLEAKYIRSHRCLGATQEWDWTSPSFSSHISNT